MKAAKQVGVWVIKTAQTIPHAELWLHQPQTADRLDRALAAMDHPPKAADLDALEQNLGKEQLPDPDDDSDYR
jgi:hypothetical protein